MVRSRVEIAGLSVAEVLYKFVEDEALPDSGVGSVTFWSGAADLFGEFGPRISAALETRDALQKKIDAYCWRTQTAAQELPEYVEFLRSIQYLVDEPADFVITTSDVDPEIASLAGPQLVVPLLNARFATNAANARWGSLYDAFYGTDVVSDDDGKERRAIYNPVRGSEVVARGRAFLDEHFPLRRGSHSQVTAYLIDVAGLDAKVEGESSGLVDSSQFVGFNGPRDQPTGVLLVNHGLHVEIQIDRDHPIGGADLAGVSDLLVESALTTIMDLEDSVAAVDADDKVVGYRNWLELMRGTLAEEVTKGGRTFTRTLNRDRTYTALSGDTTILPGRSVLFIRQVGHLMRTDAVLDHAGETVSEGILDALVTALGSAHELRRDTVRTNSRTGSMYVVKPKLHGPAEVDLACQIFTRVEEILGLPPLAIKVGIMDEERRTSANLKACVHAARDRIAFINTGFLDRTGDEIHTSMMAGPMVRKADMKSQPWIKAYEDGNIDVGLSCGLQGRAQIGKGMWAAPDSMADMLVQKIAHPLAGASCAWVPSPTAATLHALHYHQVDVPAKQTALVGRPRAKLTELLTVPVGTPEIWSSSDRQAELDNNVQGVLGYVVRWIDAGVGCSKVPDITGEALMEDRATCRISSQHIANWLRHGIVSHDQVEETLRRIAALVDEQNAEDATYVPMSPAFDGQAFLAARDLILQGLDQPSGYTEPILHSRRGAEKATRSRQGSNT